MHAGVTLKLCFVLLKTTLSENVCLLLRLSHEHLHLDTHTHARTHKASLIEFIGEWMLTRPLQVG